MRALGLLALLVSLALAACGTQLPTPAPESLTLVAVDSAAPLARRMAADYSARYPHVAVRVQVTATDLAAEASLRNGQADLALVSQAEALAAGGLYTVTQLAPLPLAVVVHPQNPVSALSLEQLRAVYTGQVDNWSQLGGQTRPLLPLVREEGAGSRAAFDAAVLQGRPLTPTALILPGDERLVAYVAEQPAAIGYVPVAWVDGRVRALAIEGFAAPMAGRRDPDYPLLMPLGMVIPRAASAAAVTFAQWAELEE